MVNGSIPYTRLLLVKNMMRDMYVYVRYIHTRTYIIIVCVSYRIDCTCWCGVVICCCCCACLLLVVGYNAHTFFLFFLLGVFVVE
jgi:hypothetical protein